MPADIEGGHERRVIDPVRDRRPPPVEVVISSSGPALRVSPASRPTRSRKV